MEDLVLRKGEIENDFFEVFFKENNYSKVTIRVSGGADSAMALYLLAMFAEQENPDLEIYAFTAVDALMLTGDDAFGKAEECAKDVVKFVKEKFPEIKIEHTIEYYTRVEFANKKFAAWGKHPNLKIGKNATIRPLLEKHILDTGSEIVIGGTTKNIHPSLRESYDDLESYPGTDYTRKKVRYFSPFGTDDHRDSDEGLTKLQDTTLFGKNATGKPQILPWGTVDKTFVGAQYEKYNLIDTLLPLTESCIYSPYMTEGRDYPFKKAPCKVCYWCNERYYTFGSFDYGEK